MSAVIDAIGDFLEDLVDAVADFVEAVWDEICMPILEEVFSWFGIEDETVVTVSKISSKVFGENEEDVVRKAFARVVIGMSKNNAGFYKNWSNEFLITKAQMRAYYSYAERDLYIYGLPEMTVKGGNIDNTAVNDAINTDLSGTFTVLTTDTTFPRPEIWFKNDLQAAPTLYLPYANTLTYDDPNSVSRDDWTFDSVDYNSGPDNYTINISRTAERTFFWIRGDEVIEEGDTGTITVFCNRPVPAGKTVTVNLAFAGGTNGTEFTAPTSLTFNAGDDQQSFTMTPGAISANATITTTFTVDDSVDNAFEHIEQLISDDSIQTTLVATDGTVVTMPFVTVSEGSTAIITVTLSAATAGAFTLNWQTIDNLSATPGIDYSQSAGTLNFAGTAGETQDISVSVSTDGFNDNYEEFGIEFTACSDPAVDITNTTIVRIVDGTSWDPAQDTIVVQETITKPAYLQERYLILTYHDTADPASEWFYWFYRLDDGTYAGVDPTISYITGLEMLPVGILRKNKQSIDNASGPEPFGTNSAVYKSTRNLLNRLSIRCQDYIDNIEENPDISLIDDAYINFSMNPKDGGSKVLSKLLWMHFYEIIVVHAITSNTEEYSVSFEEQDVNNAVVWSAHSHQGGLLISNANVDNPQVATALGVIDVGDHYHTYDSTTMYIAYKTSSTEYEIIIVENMNSLAAIAYDGFHNVAVNKLGDDAFTIPVSWFLMEQLRFEEIMEVYQYLLRLDMYSIQVTELEWYETSAFFDLFEFVLIVVTIVTAGATGSLLAALQQIAINYLIVQLVIEIAEATGNETLAVIVGIIAAVTLGDTGALPPFDMGTAEGLTRAVTQFSDTVGAVATVEMEQMQQDLDDLTAEFEAQQEMFDQYDFNEPLISGVEMAALLSVDAGYYPARELQYDFNQLYNYDRLVGDWVQTQLQLGLV